MAGIGFVLERIVERQGLRGMARAAVAGVFVVAGPWLITSVTLGGVSLIAASRGLDVSLFFSIVVYTFAASLLLLSGYHYRFTRITADLLYEKRYARLRDESLIASRKSIFAGLPIGLVIGLAARSGPLVTVAAALLAAIVSFSWIQMLLVSLLNDVRRVVIAYLIGGAVTLAIGAAIFALRGAPASAIAAERQIALRGVIAYAIGTALTAGLLARFVLNHLSRRAHSRQAVRVHGRQASTVPGVAAVTSLPADTLQRIGTVGALLAAVLWVDKVIFWIALGEPVAGSALRLVPVYDSFVYLSQLLVIPPMVFFAIRVETALYRGVRKTMQAIRGGTWQEVDRAKNRLEHDLKQLIVRQTAIQLLMVVAVALLGTARQTPQDAVILVRTALAAQFYFLMYTGLVSLLYLSDYRGARALLLVTFAIALAGAVLTVTVARDPGTIVGLSYLVASGTGAVLALRLQNHRIRSMDRLLLTRFNM